MKATADYLTESQQAPTARTANDLAQRLAGVARIVRDLIVGGFGTEKEKGWLHKWLAAFRRVLIPALDEAEFADMFAQTVAYGLFAAKVHAPPGDTFSRKTAPSDVPKTNPFLRKFFEEIAGVDIPDSIVWAVDDLVELLNRADMADIMEDFGRGKANGKQDAVVHFYETFLSAYDPKMRELRGVYYTPEPVVSYIVRSIDHLLKTRFKRNSGLTDEKTILLDPAVGTATFLYFVIDYLYHSFAKQKAAWESFVAENLLNRIFGFEILMAPYAVAHLKLGMQLQKTGYSFAPDQRLGIYLTNTLEEAAKKDAGGMFAEFVAEEADAAAEIKREKEVLVILGNPPYSGHSANKGRWIENLVDDYRRKNGKLMRLQQAKWLRDDYVKFIRFAQWRIEQTKSQQGIVAMITNHSYLDSPTFVRMREVLAETFCEIFILDLHGNAKKKERCPDGGKDENVFDIQQGVSIALFVKRKSTTGPKISFHEIWGLREAKYEWLWTHDVADTDWREIPATAPDFFFVQKDLAHKSEYDHYWSLRDVFSPNGRPAPGFLTTHDSFAISFSKQEMIAKVESLLETGSEEEARRRFRLCTQAQWNYAVAKKALAEGAWRKRVVPCLYRPFDTRWTVYDPHVLVHRRERITRHLLHEDNLALITSSLTKGEQFQHVLASRMISEVILLSPKTSNNAFAFPLYLYRDGKNDFDFAHGRRPNLGPAFLEALAKALSLAQEEPYGLPEGVTPEDVFHYAYAIFHSPTYRTRYAELLKIDFPRLPLTSKMKLFRTLAAKGDELVALHLMESPKVDDFLTQWSVKGDNVVEKVGYTEKDGRVWINEKQYFSGVPLSVWEFHVGGYQVCQTWLKYHKGRKLTYDDAQHYQRIVVVLNETTRLMEEIDAQIAKHGGWPIE